MLNGVPKYLRKPRMKSSYLLSLAESPVFPQQQADLRARLHRSAAQPLDGVIRL